MAKDDTRKFRVDFDGHADKPYVHIAVKVNSEWKNVGSRHRYYPKED